MDLPRVTEILHVYSGYQKIPQDILKNAAARGTKVHALCAAIAKGAWIPDGMIDEEHRGYVESFKKWSEAQVEKFQVIEKRYNHEKLKYTGQVDFVVHGSDGNKWLVDLKTSARPQKTYPLQMAAYDFLLKSHMITVKGAMIVYLKKDGEFPDIHRLDDMTNEFRVFMSALDCWYYFNKRKDDGREERREKHLSENSGSDE